MLALDESSARPTIITSPKLSQTVAFLIGQNRPAAILAHARTVTETDEVSPDDNVFGVFGIVSSGSLRRERNTDLSLNLAEMVPDYDRRDVQ